MIVFKVTSSSVYVHVLKYIYLIMLVSVKYRLLHLYVFYGGSTVRMSNFLALEIWCE